MEKSAGAWNGAFPAGNLNAVLGRCWENAEEGISKQEQDLPVEAQEKENEGGDEKAEDH